jgi:uncharacterized zinc-type alcohol dehydrogenase-like protein
MPIRAYAAAAPRAPFQRFDYEPGALPADWLEVQVESCGVCHSDLSMLDDEWRRTRYPLVPGHEIVGTVIAVGDAVKRVAPGDRVGIGWYVSSCLACDACLRGDHHFCSNAVQTIVGNHGGFADRVRCHWVWATPLPDYLDAASAGPLFCGGITVFNPIVEAGLNATARSAVVGIGGLGHLALKFLHHFGCEVTAFTSTERKRDEALSLGADAVADSTSKDAWRAHAGRFDFVLVTVNAPLPWEAVLASLAPRGRLHVVGAVLEPIPVPAFALIGGHKTISGSPVGSPSRTAQMLDFCRRHAITPQIERFPISRVNDAIEHLRAGRARYRIVLDNDFPA